jgi:hypothetical protein
MEWACRCKPATSPSLWGAYYLGDERDGHYVYNFDARKRTDRDGLQSQVEHVLDLWQQDAAAVVLANPFLLSPLAPPPSIAKLSLPTEEAFLDVLLPMLGIELHFRRSDIGELQDIIYAECRRVGDSTMIAAASCGENVSEEATARLERLCDANHKLPASFLSKNACVNVQSKFQWLAAYFKRERLLLEAELEDSDPNDPM